MPNLPGVAGAFSLVQFGLRDVVRHQRDQFVGLLLGLGRGDLGSIDMDYVPYSGEAEAPWGSAGETRAACPEQALRCQASRRSL